MRNSNETGNIFRKTFRLNEVKSIPIMEGITIYLHLGTLKSSNLLPSHLYFPNHLIHNEYTKYRAGYHFKICNKTSKTSFISNKTSCIFLKNLKKNLEKIVEKIYS